MKTQKFRFIGYTGTTWNYKVWDEVELRCYVRHDIVFNENNFGKQSETSQRPHYHKALLLPLCTNHTN